MICFQIDAQVFLGFLLPVLWTYKAQLHTRRLWREDVLERLAEDPPGSSRRGAPLPDHDPGLDILPTWVLLLPQSVVILVLSFVAGHDFKLLQYMV